MKLNKTNRYIIKEFYANLTIAKIMSNLYLYDSGLLFFLPEMLIIHAEVL